ncbi:MULTISPECIES: PEP/pyruvate-binding domain-containing protein [unclassified Mameliella]|uniref:PEP/pyruvate-binding domain-containing protein n=2 Tax=unclassified Mameliella TaxID=2630630 RepID=UPI00273FF53A|nr:MULTISPECIES: PEP/pyruvate-binding domain-containing protein [unclassified Mameliella]
MKGVIPADRALDPQEVGGKAAALSRLKAAGFDVPGFLVLADDAFTDHGTDLAETVTGALPDALAALGPGPFAVRSSARAEDGAEASHAGQFDTVLNVPACGIAAAAAQVRASGEAEHVARYQADRGVDDSGLPAVLVQCMIAARTAGVAFSADPVSGRRDLCVVSAVEGLADALVGGEVNGESWTVSPDGVIDAPEPPEVLTPQEATEVAELARRAEAAFGAPQDIEWAYDGARLHLLQSRPITTDLRLAPRPDAALVVLDNSNIVESYPGLVSPLTYSFAAYCYNRVYRAFVRLLGLSEAQIAENAAVFDNLLTRIDGRVYYNLGNWYRALALLPAFSLNRGYMETMMGVEESLPAELTDRLAPDPARGWQKVSAFLALGRVAGGLAFEAMRLGRTRRHFLARLQSALDEGADTDGANLTQLAALYRRIEGRLLDRWDAPLVNDFLCMMGFGASRALLKRWAGEAGESFHNDVMIGQGGIVSAEPARRIAAMGRMARETPGAQEALGQGRPALRDFPDLDAAVAAYLDEFGDRCTEELKLESLPLSEAPAPLLAAIASAARRSDEPQARRSAPDWHRLFPGQPLRRAVARALTGWAAARVRDRENLRFERTRIFALARRCFLAMGREFHARGLLDAPRDVLFLTVPEVMGTIEGNAPGDDLRALAAMRKGEAEASENRPAPPERIELRGPVGAYRPAPAAFPETEGGDGRTGTGCSKGKITGRARVVRDPRREMLEPGEILVASNTDPGWIALFAGAAAIVVERGSLLSHSAIVSREMGIPCVVGIRDATRWLRTGDLIEVDGGTGEVRKRDG